MMAAERGHIHTVEVLIAGGANINVRSEVSWEGWRKCVKRECESECKWTKNRFKCGMCSLCGQNCQGATALLLSK